MNEYGLHLAQELRSHPEIKLTIIADVLDNYNFATDGDGKPLEVSQQSELPGFDVVRCWRFGSLRNPARLLRVIRQIDPDVVWFNLVFSSFGTPDEPMAAMSGLSAPVLIRAAGFYTHITLHHILEHVDMSAAGIRLQSIFRMGTVAATRMLLKAHSVSVLLSGYQRTLTAKYGASNVLLGTHGILGSMPSPPDFGRRGNPEHRIVAIGHWGTYKRLETLMEAFPAVLEEVPNTRLIIGGANHHTKAGYWEEVREAQPPHLPIEFRGYIPEDQIPSLFQTASVVVMPYDSATGSSGPAHQACEFGVPIVSADLPDFRDMATEENMAIRFYRVGDAVDLASQIITILRSSDMQWQMSVCNYQAGLQMTMARVTRNYLRWFELQMWKRKLRRRGLAARLRRLRHQAAGALTWSFQQHYPGSDGVATSRLAYVQGDEEPWPKSKEGAKENL